MQILGKQMCRAIRDNGTQGNFNKHTLLSSSLFTHLTTPVVICNDSSLLERGPLSIIFRYLWRRSNILPESLGPCLFSDQNNPHAKEIFGVSKLCSPTVDCTCISHECNSIMGRLRQNLSFIRRG